MRDSPHRTNAAPLNIICADSAYSSLALNDVPREAKEGIPLDSRAAAAHENGGLRGIANRRVVPYVFTAFMKQATKQNAYRSLQIVPIPFLLPLSQPVVYTLSSAHASPSPSALLPSPPPQTAPPSLSWPKALRPASSSASRAPTHRRSHPMLALERGDAIAFRHSSLSSLFPPPPPPPSPVTSMAPLLATSHLQHGLDTNGTCQLFAIHIVLISSYHGRSPIVLAAARAIIMREAVATALTTSIRADSKLPNPRHARGHGSWSANLKPDTIKSLFFRGPKVINLPAVKSLPPNFKTRRKYPEIKTSSLKRLLSYSRRLWSHLALLIFLLQYRAAPV
ncbi:hypothetical protein DFH09DRAFT_1369019 [Mycena vulgaris]|nr:hypothetical protein DFH09DRAFT_1369019 [Mycena vulgaris]